VGLLLERLPESMAQPSGRFAATNHQHLLVIGELYRLIDSPNAQSIGLPIEATGDRFVGLNGADSRPPEIDRQLRHGLEGGQSCGPYEKTFPVLSGEGLSSASIPTFGSDQ
jgi:hypothetical protein